MDNKYSDAVSYIKSKIKVSPEVGIILGSGLNSLAESVESSVVLPYKSIPNFPLSTAPDHKGRLVIGHLFGKKVICMQGRLHYYEGHSPDSIIFPIRIMKLLGVSKLIVTNAAGGINESFNKGDIMVIKDHINLTGSNPLIGKNNEEFGTRFPDMTTAYSPNLIKLANTAAMDIGINLKSGVYIGVSGPSFETPAEIKAFRVLGADAVGMSTVFEVIAAAHLDMEVLGFSLIANMAAGMLPEKLSGSDVNEAGESASNSLKLFFERVFNYL